MRKHETAVCQTARTVEVTYKGTRSETYNEYSEEVKIPTEIIY
jgi:hypothetical protein